MKQFTRLAEVIRLVLCSLFTRRLSLLKILSKTLYKSFVNIKSLNVSKRKSITNAEFWNFYLRPYRNIPVLFTRSCFNIQKWKAWQWRRKDSSGLKFNFIAEKFGNHKVPVISYSKKSKKILPSKNLLFRSFCELIDKNRSHLPTEKSQEHLHYMKDCHFVKILSGAQIYETPSLFQNDWLNDYCDDRNIDDFRFLYLGMDPCFSPQ